MMTRDTLKPPPVEPAHPPTNIRVNKIILENVDHFAKSAVAKPVVVIIEDTWKNA